MSLGRRTVCEIAIRLLEIATSTRDSEYLHAAVQGLDRQSASLVRVKLFPTRTRWKGGLKHTLFRALNRTRVFRESLLYERLTALREEVKW